MGFLLFFFTVLAVVYGYTGLRTIQPSRMGPAGKVLAWGMLLLLLVFPLLAVFLRMEDREGLWSETAAWVGFLGTGFLSLAFALVLTRDVVLIPVGLFRWLRKRWRKRSSLKREGPEDPLRRRFLVQSTNTALMGATVLSCGYGVLQARRLPVTREVDIPLQHLPPEMEGFRIVQITDIHAGPTVKGDFVGAAVEKANRLDPDLVALTGDLVDGSVPYLRGDVASIAELSAPFGVFFVTGNHEYYSGALAWVEEIRRLGLTVLINEHRVLTVGGKKLLLAGVTDYAAGHYVAGHESSPSRALAGSPLCDLRILLAHQPKSIFEAAAAGFDLQISGHTHGGQYFPGNLVLRAFQPYISGLHTHGGTQIYVSRGTGYWGPPLRLGVPSEITVLRLTRAS
jgi:predicted MPP superfamily phosphohydrolase